MFNVGDTVEIVCDCCSMRNKEKLIGKLGKIVGIDVGFEPYRYAIKMNDESLNSIMNGRSVFMWRDSELVLYKSNKRID